VERRDAAPHVEQRERPELPQVLFDVGGMATDRLSDTLEQLRLDDPCPKSRADELGEVGVGQLLQGHDAFALALVGRSATLERDDQPRDERRRLFVEALLEYAAARRVHVVRVVEDEEGRAAPPESADELEQCAGEGLGGIVGVDVHPQDGDQRRDVGPHEAHRPQRAHEAQDVEGSPWRELEQGA
jgi:hypothetical protein